MRAGGKLGATVNINFRPKNKCDVLTLQNLIAYTFLTFFITIFNSAMLNVWGE